MKSQAAKTLLPAKDGRFKNKAEEDRSKGGKLCAILIHFMHSCTLAPAPPPTPFLSHFQVCTSTRRVWMPRCKPHELTELIKELNLPHELTELIEGLIQTGVYFHSACVDAKMLAEGQVRMSERMYCKLNIPQAYL